MDDGERYRIERVSEGGQPIAPTDVKKKFVKACGVVIRDHIPITTREWLKPRTKGVSYVVTVAKENLWRKLMLHFTLPAPEVDPDEEEPNKEKMKRRKEAPKKKVKELALKKMVDLFRGSKKRLHQDFILQDKTPDFDNGYEKIKDCWTEFVAYKKLEDVLKKSATNKRNARMKKYHHIMGLARYACNMAMAKKS